MTGIKEFKNTIKNFREKYDYSIEYIEGENRKIYTIHSQELKQVLFAGSIRGGIVSAEAKCKIEQIGEDIKKTISMSVSSASSGQNENFERGQISSGSSLVFPNHREENSLISSSNFLTQRVPTYDKSGRLLTDQREIEEEVDRRRVEWTQWEREGKVKSLSHPFSNSSNVEPLIKFNPRQVEVIPTYDKSGRLLTDQREIEEEVDRRRVEWTQWEREGKVKKSGRQERTVTEEDADYYEYFETCEKTEDKDSSKMEHIEYTKPK